MVHCAKRCIHEQFIHEHVCIVSNCYPQTAMGQVTSRCERRRSIRLPPIATEESYGSSVCSVRTGHSIDSNRFEQSLSYVLTEHGLRVTSNIFYDESMNILDNTAALHDARIFILQTFAIGAAEVASPQRWFEARRAESIYQCCGQVVRCWWQAGQAATRSTGQECARAL